MSPTSSSQQQHTGLGKLTASPPTGTHQLLSVNLELKCILILPSLAWVWLLGLRKFGPRKIGKAHADSFFLSGGNGPGVGGFCRVEGPHLAQLLPAAPKFRLRRVTLPLATNLGFCPAVADGGVAKGICLCLAECLECLCIKAVLSAAGSGWIGCDGWAERKRA